MSREILSGWKEIATYLGMGLRTVQRYERKLELPIHRPGGKLRGSVISTVDELEAWVKGRPIRAEFRLKYPASNKEILKRLRRNIEELSRLLMETQQARKAHRDALELLRKNVVFAIPGPLSLLEAAR